MFCTRGSGSTTQACLPAHLLQGGEAGSRQAGSLERPANPPLPMHPRLKSNE